MSTVPAAIASRGLERLLPTYARADLTLVQGEGCRVWDATAARTSISAAASPWCRSGTVIPPRWLQRRRSSTRLWHASNLYRTEPAEQLAALLSDRFGGASGVLLQLGCRGHRGGAQVRTQGDRKTRCRCPRRGFHGRTLGALSATGQPAKREPFAPLVPGVRFVEPNDVGALGAAVDEEVGLILLEPILGEGGVIPLEPEFVAAAASMRRPPGFDEVQTGVGRTGTFFAFEQLGVRPDLVTLAKGLANGLPIGALLVTDEAPGALRPGGPWLDLRRKSGVVRCGVRRRRDDRRRAARWCPAPGAPSSWMRAPSLGRRLACAGVGC